jgi:hypothetical protein
MYVLVFGDSLEQQATARSYMYRTTACRWLMFTQTGQNQSHFSAADDRLARSLPFLVPFETLIDTRTDLVLSHAISILTFYLPRDTRKD